MSDDARIARIEALARRLWSPEEEPHFGQNACLLGIFGVDDKPLLTFLNTYWAGRGIHMLEAALLAALNEPPQWAVEFAESLSNEEMPLSGHRVARELLATARGKEL
jgi:hypothetical protein